MAERVGVTPEEKAEMWRRYERGDSMESIARYAGVCRQTFDRWVHQWGWPRRGGAGVAAHRRALMRRQADAAAIAAAASAGVGSADGAGSSEGTAAALDRAGLAGRLRGAIEAELAAADLALRRWPAASRRPAEMERAARTLASLVKALGELQRLEAAAVAADGAGEEEAAYGDPDALRLELHRRLEGLRRRHREEEAEMEAGAGI